jgi:hypothetical protein
VTASSDGAFATTDANGLPLSLELIDVVQPVARSKEHGGYFACALFRKIGSDAGFYSVDFTLDQKTGSVSAGGVKQIEIPLAKVGKTAPLPPCHFEGAAFAVVD